MTRKTFVSALILVAGVSVSAGCATTQPAPGRPGMVLIPSGAFTMGSSSAQAEAALRLCERERAGACDPESYVDETPARAVQLDAYFVDVHEVTVEAYATCVEGGACTEPGTQAYCNWGSVDRGQHPINCVTWEQARAFCEWAGKRLPTEAEWERAARGDKPRRYPWGSVHPAHQPQRVGNFADQAGTTVNPMWEGAVAGYDDGFDGTAPVGSFPRGASPWGIQDMAGNVSEWTADAYTRDVRVAAAGPVPAMAMGRVARGGSFSSVAADIRTSARTAAPTDAPYNTVGVRCAADPR